VEQTRAIAHARALSLAAVYGGVGLRKQAQSARRAHVVVATPGRLIDLLDRGDLRLDRVGILVLDEADRMLDMGFRPDVDRIVDATPRNRQTLLFSATLDGEVGRIAKAYTRDPRRHEHRLPPERTSDIEHRFVRVEHTAKVERLVRELDSVVDARTLVFVRTKRGADRLVKRLGNRRIEAAAMHGDKSQAQREKALGRFEAGRVDTLVATDVAARGIDVDDITHVINFDVPADREGYVHRVGRTGRAGRSGVAITFVLPDQSRDTARMAVALGLEREFESGGLAVDRADRTDRQARARPAASRRPPQTSGRRARRRRSRARPTVRPPR
jgi:ATP-dependent RNA helicase RhlE